MKLPSTNQEGAAKTDAGILIMAIFFAGILFIAFTTNPVCMLALRKAIGVLCSRVLPMTKILGFNYVK